LTRRVWVAAIFTKTALHLACDDSSQAAGAGLVIVGGLN
jgi:hypothetical protein